MDWESEYGLINFEQYRRHKCINAHYLISVHWTNWRGLLAAYKSGKNIKFDYHEAIVALTNKKVSTEEFAFDRSKA